MAGVRKWLLVDEQGDANIVEVCHCSILLSHPMLQSEPCLSDTWKGQMHGLLQATQRDVSCGQ